MSSNDPKKGEMQEPFGDLMKSMNDFFYKRPIKGFLQSMDEFFMSSFTSFPVHVKENDENHLITAELPGVKREQISIDVIGSSLTISVKNNEVVTEEDEGKQILKKRQSFQHMSRTMYLGQPIDEKRVKASYKDGLLKISVPKQKGKKIIIDAE